MLPDDTSCRSRHSASQSPGSSRSFGESFSFSSAPPRKPSAVSSVAPRASDEEAKTLNSVDSHEEEFVTSEAANLAARITAIWRYPVKSMIGEELGAVTVTKRGLSGDRAFALVDCESNGGVYATVIRGGTIRRGDAVALE